MFNLKIYAKNGAKAKIGINAEKAHLCAKVIPKNAQKDADAKRVCKKNASGIIIFIKFSWDYIFSW